MNKLQLQFSVCSVSVTSIVSGTGCQKCKHSGTLLIGETNIVEKIVYTFLEDFIFLHDEELKRSSCGSKAVYRTKQKRKIFTVKKKHAICCGTGFKSGRLNKN